MREKRKFFKKLGENMIESTLKVGETKPDKKSMAKDYQREKIKQNMESPEN